MYLYTKLLVELLGDVGSRSFILILQKKTKTKIVMSLSEVHTATK